MKKLLLPIFVLAVLLAGCGSDPSNPSGEDGGMSTTMEVNRIGLHYKDGPFQQRQFEQLIQPGSGRTWLGISDKVYKYPTDQRTYIIDGTPEAGDTDRADFISSPSASEDGQTPIPFAFEVSIFFTLNTADEETLVEFHESIGLKTEAWNRDGWNQMLGEYFRPQIERAFRTETPRYTKEQLYADPDVLIELEESIGDGLKARIANAMGGDYFCGPGESEASTCGDIRLNIKNPRPISSDVISNFEEVANASLRVEAQRQETIRRTEEARGIREVSDALAEAGPAYNVLRAIEEGTVELMVIPDGTNVAVAPSQPQGENQEE